MKPLTVLACDPSLTAWGYSVIRNGKIIKVGCIKTEGTPTKKRRIRKSDDTFRRIDEINEELLQTISTLEVNYIVSEAPHGSQSSSAADAIGIVKGILHTMAKCMDIPIEWYSEGDAKNAVLGKCHGASKHDMVKAIDCLYKVEWTKAGFRNEAIADSLAIYHVACKESPTIRFLLSNKEGKSSDVPKVLLNEKIFDNKLGLTEISTSKMIRRSK